MDYPEKLPENVEVEKENSDQPSWPNPTSHDSASVRADPQFFMKALADDMDNYIHSGDLHSYYQTPSLLNVDVLSLDQYHPAGHSGYNSQLVESLLPWPNHTSQILPGQINSTPNSPDVDIPPPSFNSWTGVPRIDQIGSRDWLLVEDNPPPILPQFSAPHVLHQSSSSPSSAANKESADEPLLARLEPSPSSRPHPRGGTPVGNVPQGEGSSLAQRLAEAVEFQRRQRCPVESVSETSTSTNATTAVTPTSRHLSLSQWDQVAGGGAHVGEEEEDEEEEDEEEIVSMAGREDDLLAVVQGANHGAFQGLYRLERQGSGSRFRVKRMRRCAVEHRAESGMSHGWLSARMTFVTSPLGKQLVALAEAVVTQDQRLAQLLLRLLNERSDPYGDSCHRITFYFIEGLKIRQDGTGSQRSSRGQVTSVQAVERALVEVQRRVPYWKCLERFTVQLMLEACEGSRKVHILDLTLWGGDYWSSLIHTIATLGDDAPLLRVTKLAPVGAASDQIEKTAYQMGQPILRAANRVGLPIEFNLVQESIENLTPSLLGLDPDETLLVNASQCLYTLSDETVLRSSPRDAALRAIRKLSPALLILNEMYADLKGPFFLSRVQDALGFYDALFESLQQASPRNSQERHIFERLVGQDIVNIVACEGMQRIVRPELPKGWNQRMEKNGFTCQLASDALRDDLDDFVKRFSPNYCIAEEDDMLLLKWKNRGMGMMSAWQVAH